MASRRLLGERVAVRAAGCPPRDGVLISGVKKETKFIQKFPVRFPNGDVRTYRGDQLLLRGTKAPFLEYIRVGDILFTKKTLGVVRFVGMHEDFLGPVLVMESVDPKLPADESITSFRKMFPSANLIEGGNYNLIRRLEEILKLLPPDALLTQISKIKDKYLAFKSESRRKEQISEAEKDNVNKQIAELEARVKDQTAANGRAGEATGEYGKKSVPVEVAADVMINEIMFRPGLLGVKASWSTGRMDGISEDGQASNLGVEVGWKITHIDGEPYSENLLDSKTRGSEDYLLTFVAPREKPKPEATAPSPTSLPKEDAFRENEREYYEAKISELNEQIEEYQTTVESLQKRTSVLEEEHKEMTKLRVKVEHLRNSRMMFMGQIKDMQKQTIEWKKKAQEFDKKVNKVSEKGALAPGEVKVEDRTSPPKRISKFRRMPKPDGSNTVQLGNTPKIGSGASGHMTMAELQNASSTSPGSGKKRSWFKGGRAGSS